MQANESDLALFQRAFEANGSPRTLDHLRWQYLEPPVGRVYVDVAVTQGDDPRFAAIYAVFPVRMKAGGQRRVVGTQSLNTLTDEAFRGKGLFVKLAASLYARLRDEAVALVYGFPNGNSAHGFFKRLEWVTLDPVPQLARPLRTGYVLRRVGVKGLAGRLLDWRIPVGGAPKLPAGTEIREVAEPGPEFDAVWTAFAQGISYAVERDSEYLRWRLRRPGEQYRTLGLYEQGTLRAFVVTGVVSTPTFRTGKLMDLVFDPAHPKAGAAVLREALRRLAADACEGVIAWCFEHSPNHAVLRRAGFVNVPAKLRPLELHAGARAFAAPSGGPDVSDRANWYVSMLDCDTD